MFSNCHKEDIIFYPAEGDTEFDKGSSIDFPELNEQLIANLDLLGKIWGFLKYHHPVVGKGKYNWDYELFRILPKYLKVKNNEERDKFILDWINKYGKIPACTTCQDTRDAFIKPDLSWVESRIMNSDLKGKIREIKKNRYQGDHYYVRMSKEMGNHEFLHEKSYSGLIYPDAGFRLLALFRYWNMIQYYYPDKYLADKDWNDVLSEYIPIFLTVENRLAYELAVLQMIGEMWDSHAGYLMEGCRTIEEELRGNKYAPFRVWFIEGKLVVTDYYNWRLKETSGPEPGDIITHIDGETVESIVIKMKNYYPAANNARKLHDISFDILRSKKSTSVINYISYGQSVQKEIPLYNRNQMNIYKWIVKNERSFKLLSDDIGYVTVASITIEDIQAIRELFQNTKGIIIDIRNYPPIWPSLHLAYSLGSWFIYAPSPVSKISNVNLNNPGEFIFTPIASIQNTGSVTYLGKVIVLVNEITLSSAECFAMIFRAGVNTTIIGSTTAASLGVTTTICLPGGIETRFTSIGFYYPDGTPTQRVGIVPDVWVEPTIEGIRQGRDELLEKAISLINEE